MDHTPVYHSMDSGRTIDWVGMHTVNLRMSMNNSVRVIIATIITALGRKTKSMVVFKGEYGIDGIMI